MLEEAAMEYTKQQGLCTEINSAPGGSCFSRRKKMDFALSLASIRYEGRRTSTFMCGIVGGGARILPIGLLEQCRCFIPRVVSRHEHMFQRRYCTTWMAIAPTYMQPTNTNSIAGALSVDRVNRGRK